MSEKDVRVLWNSACAHLREVLRADVYSRWIEVITPVDITDDALTLEVDNDFYHSWLEENYLSLIKQAVAAVADFEPQIRFSVRPSPARPPGPAQPAPRRPTRERPSRLSTPPPALNPKFTFDSFIVGPSNTFTHAAALAVAQAPARAYNPLFIYGDVGLGKTHIMQAVGHHVLNSCRASVCYLSSEAFTNEYIDALQNRNLVQFRKKYRNTDLLLIDDIHFLAGKERLQEEFFHTFNALFDAHKQIVMTSDRPASEIARLEQRLVSRFEWGLVTELEPPDLETRIAILRYKQEGSGMVLPDEIIQFIAQNVRSNIRRLEGAFVRTVSYASLTGRPVTLDTVRYLLRDMLDQEQQEEVTFDRIQRAVAEHYDVRLSDMTSKRRPRTIAVPRQIAMYLCRRMTRSSLPDIANAFGKTHATVLHACRSVDNRMDVEPRLRQDILQISQRLGRPLSVERLVGNLSEKCDQ
ncbi:MAG: chromosomal replication initiator protein DnaA [Lentisphaerae bacterium]|nr:chromosomal replication initiator protein DnaA [Lentisphaerota bacterium]